MTSLEEYAHDLEMKLAMKATLLEEALQLHHGLEIRLSSLESGLSWKDAQIEVLARRIDEACREKAAWRERAERLEEENCVLRDALLERSEEIAQLRQLLEGHARRSSPRWSAFAALPDEQQKVCDRLSQQLKELNQKNVLLEEQLRIRSSSDDCGFRAAAPNLDAMPEFGVVLPESTWASVGRGASDRFCGVSKYLEERTDYEDTKPAAEKDVVEDIEESSNPNSGSTATAPHSAPMHGLPEHRFDSDGRDGGQRVGSSLDISLQSSTQISLPASVVSGISRANSAESHLGKSRFSVTDQTLHPQQPQQVPRKQEETRFSPSRTAVRSHKEAVVSTIGHHWIQSPQRAGAGTMHQPSTVYRGPAAPTLGKLASAVQVPLKQFFHRGDKKA